MTALRFRIVDVFTERPLAGNALCVVLDPCPESRMQAIAREANLSETTFAEVTGPGEYRMRIFTPADELPFAGHPSLGTAWALGPGTWRQATSGAEVTVVADERGAAMGQPAPDLTEVDATGVAAALGLAGAEGAWLGEVGGMGHVLVPTTAPLGDLRPDLGEVARRSTALGGRSLCPVRRVDDRTLHVRVFLPAIGIPEDPGTGSAAGPVAVLARRLWGTEPAVTIRQGDEMGRPCRIDVDVDVDGSGGEVRVGGAVVAAADGHWLV